METELVLLEKEFEINKRTIPYSKLIRIHLYSMEENKGKRKLRIVMIDEEFAITANTKEAVLKDKLDEIFLRLLRIKLETKEIKFTPLERKTSTQEYSTEQKEGALAYDRIFKKSQIIGTW